MSERTSPAEIYLSRQDAAQKMGMCVYTLDVAIPRLFDAKDAAANDKDVM